MTKTALLKNSTALEVVKSEKLPATRPQRQYADFDAFVENADKLVAFFGSVHRIIERLDLDERFEWIEWPDPDRHALDLEQAKRKIAEAKYAVQAAKNTLRQFPQMRKPLAEFKRDEKWYNRKELYDIKRKGKSEQWWPSRRFVAEQIGLLLASFQNARPGTPKVFGKMVVEEVYANGPNACVLESACRLVRRTKDFPPSIAEVLKAIKEEGSAWCKRWEWLDPEDGVDSDEYFRCLETAITEAEAIIAKAEAKLVEREAKEKAAEEKRRAYWEAYERIPERERRAYESGKAHRGWSERVRPPMPTDGLGIFDHEDEWAAYCAGRAGEEIPGLEIKINGAGETGG
jgi:hypothetical protein